MAHSPAAEQSLDAEDVRALLRAESPQLAELPLALAADGWDNMIWRLGDDLAVRIPRREIAAPLIEHEQRALPVLGPRLALLGIRTPVPIVAGRPSAAFGWPWSVVPWISGVRALDRPRVDNSRWAAALAGAVLALHQPAPADAPANPVRGVPLRARDAVMRERLALLPDRSALRDAWAAGVAAPPASEHVWIHGDLHPGNIIVNDGTLDALIDFGDVTGGDPAYDLAAAWLVFDATGRARFRTGTGDRYDSATWTRARAWAAYLAAMLLTQSDDRPDYLALGRSTAAELARFARSSADGPDQLPAEDSAG